MVSDREPGPVARTGEDLEYDLAHEASGVTTSPASESGSQPQPVVTDTPEYDGDYSYDLAHDIPGR